MVEGVTSGLTSVEAPCQPLHHHVSRVHWWCVGLDNQSPPLGYQMPVRYDSLRSNLQYTVVQLNSIFKTKVAYHRGEAATSTNSIHYDNWNQIGLFQPGLRP